MKLKPILFKVIISLILAFTLAPTVPYIYNYLKCQDIGCIPEYVFGKCVNLYACCNPCNTFSEIYPKLIIVILIIFIVSYLILYFLAKLLNFSSWTPEVKGFFLAPIIAFFYLPFTFFYFPMHFFTNKVFTLVSFPKGIFATIVAVIYYIPAGLLNFIANTKFFKVVSLKPIIDSTNKYGLDVYYKTEIFKFIILIILGIIIFGLFYGAIGYLIGFLIKKFKKNK